MTRFIVVAITVALGGMACTGDPTASLRGGPAGISITPTTLYAFDDSVAQKIEIVVRDAQLNALAVPVTVASSDVAVFTVAPDALPEANGDRHVYFATPLAPGQAVLRIEGGGVRDSATVNVLPQVFGGVPSSTSLLVGDEYQLLATSVLKFDATSTDISFGVGECGTADELEPCAIHGLITKRNADTLTVIVPEVDGGQPAPLTVEDVVITYVTGLKADLPTAAAHNIQNRFSDSDAPAPTDPDANFTITAGGPPIVFYDGFRSSRCADGVLVSGGSCDRFYRLTLPAAATFTVRLEWDTDADVDVLFCSTAACTALRPPFGGATGANPESVTASFAAGTYGLYLNLWLSHDADDIEVQPRLYKVTITPQ